MARSKGSAAKHKGKVWEREVAYEHLAQIFGEVRRGRQSREGHDEADVVLPDVVPFWPECEHAKENNIRAKLRQAVAAVAASTKGPKIPVAFLKETHRGKPGTWAEPPIVAMYLPDWLALVGEWWAARTSGPTVSISDAVQAAGVLEKLRAAAALIAEAEALARGAVANPKAVEE